MATIDRHKRVTTLAGLALILILAMAACRGSPSGKPPIHPVLNMDFQPRVSPQAESPVFQDLAGMRTPVPGTVARGQLNEDAAYYTGKDSSGAFVRGFPVPVTMELLERGHERYDIYCSPCHSRLGDGKGVLSRYGFPEIASHQDPRLVEIEEGYLFEAVTNGYNNMPAYRNQVPVPDRWAVIAYMRALQRSQQATADDLPAEKRNKLKRH